MFMKITVFWGISLWIHQIIDVFIIYCGEGRRHISVFSWVQRRRLIYSLATFELRWLPSGSTNCINVLTLCIYNKSYLIAHSINHFLLLHTGFCSLPWRWRQPVPTYQQHGHNPENNLNLVTCFNFSFVRALKTHFHFDLILVTEKYQGREISV